ncbi:iron-siderophore ABC transporter substrate-binding protein [Cyanobium sp. CH-040]|nr:iron-siderophore ABC transporter substrate-binding protein [Cyanobium sp. CH-040]
MGDCRDVQHELGTTEICGHPQRIAVLSPHTLDVVLSLGAQPAAYAESKALSVGRFENPGEQIPYLGNRITTRPVNLGDRKSPSLEKLILLQPDLILGEDWLAGHNYKLLSSIAPTLLFSDYRNGIQHWRNTIEGIANALGRDQAIDEVNAELAQEFEATRQSLAPVVEEFPRVLILSVNTAMTDLAIAADSTVGTLLEQIGFELVFPQTTLNAGSRWLQSSVEVLPTLEADIAIIIGWHPSEFFSPLAELKRNWSKNPLLKNIPAAKENRLFFVDYQLWGSNIRGPITDQLILQRLPELFSPLIPG